MAEEENTKVRLEIAHVLFIDIIGYSKLSIDDQRRAIERLNDAVQSTAAFQQAEAAARLAKIPTGDGMALVFYDSPESPWNAQWKSAASFRRRVHRVFGWEFIADPLARSWMS